MVAGALVRPWFVQHPCFLRSEFPRVSPTGACVHCDTVQLQHIQVAVLVPVNKIQMVARLSLPRQFHISINPGTADPSSGEAVPLALAGIVLGQLAPSGPHRFDEAQEARQAQRPTYPWHNRHNGHIRLHTGSLGKKRAL